MKRLLLIMTLSTIVTTSRATITYDFIEYKPVGKHYNTKWNKLYYASYVNVTNDRLTLLYFKADNGVMMFKGFWVSKSLEAKLPILVQKYIGKYIADVKLKETKSVRAALTATQEAVNKALDQKYKNLLLNEGHRLVQDSAYYRGHFHSEWYMPEYYYDYEPTFSKDTVNLFLTNSISDSRFPSIWYISDTLKHFGYHHDLKSLAKWGNVFRKVRTTPGKRTIKDYGFVSSIKSDENYHKRSDSCRFTLKKVSLTHGDRYPVFASVSIFGWHATYCNFFASDLRKAVFGNPIWNTKGCETDYADLKINTDFVELKKEEIYKYSNAGYFVFLIDEGHISTVYPNGNKYHRDNIEYPEVIQAGGKTGIFSVFTPWAKFNSEKSIKCYVYLGYLKTAI